MAGKKNFVLRIDEATYAAIEKWAADEFRSVNGHLEWMLTQVLKDAGRLPKDRGPKSLPSPEEETTK